MIQEYLFLDNSQFDKIKGYKPDDIHVEISEIENSDCWMVSYSLPHNDEQTAKKLSEVNQFIIETYHPIVLSNESAAYFNKKLYPLANEFERKLRKLLYLKSALSPNDEASENIKDLESKDLGEIFELLFSDDQFVTNVKKKINKEMTWQFTKSELKKVIDELSENTNWDHLIGKEAVTELSENFSSVKSYRNDIMHAHNINYQEYKKAKDLFVGINQQIDLEIGKIIETVETASVDETESNYNSLLSKAIKSMKIIGSVMSFAQEAAAIQADFAPALLQWQKILSNIPKVSSDYYDSLQKLTELGRKIALSSELRKLTDLSEPQKEISSNIEKTDDECKDSQQDNVEEEQSDGENENGNA